MDIGRVEMGRVGGIAGWLIVGILCCQGPGLRCATAQEKGKTPAKPLAGFDRPEELQQFVDANGDGVVTDAEAKGASAAIQKETNGRKKTERGEAILAALDQNKNGKVDTDEAEQAVAEDRRERDEIGQQVGAMFDKLDTNTDKTLDVNEFRQLIEKLGPLGQLLQPRLAAFFNTMDGNQDGRITVVESQFAADYFAAQANIKREQKAAAQNAKLVQMVQQTFVQLDKNSNQKISQREAKANPQVETVFNLADKNSDKNLTPEEVYKYLEATQPLPE